MTQLGGHAIYLTEDTVLGARESRPRRRPQPRAVRRRHRRPDRPPRGRRGARRAGDIPVINGLTLREHPCQALADVFTIRERFGRLRAPSSRSSATATTSTTRWRCSGAALGMEIRLAHPAGYAPERADRRARPGRWPQRPAAGSCSARIRPSSCVAPTSSTPTPGRRWARRPRPRNAATPSPRYRVDDALLDAAGPDAVVMHCLPAHRGEEITSEVMDGPRSIIFDQSENRLHVQKALLVELHRGAGDDYRHRMSDALYERTRTRCGVAMSPRCAAGSTSRSTPTARRPDSPRPGAAATSASAAS